MIEASNLNLNATTPSYLLVIDNVTLQELWICLDGALAQVAYSRQQRQPQAVEIRCLGVLPVPGRSGQAAT
jgi:hypothetical protein